VPGRKLAADENLQHFVYAKKNNLAFFVKNTKKLQQHLYGH